MPEDTFHITLRNDYAFKRVFGTEENKPVLQDFLECVLDIPAGDIAGLELLDKELSKEALTDKTGILDIKLLLQNKTVIDIEIQSLWNTEFVPRILFYWSKMFIENFKEGQPYTSLNKCITISLVAEGFKLHNNIHTRYHLLEEGSHTKLTDLMEIHFLNLSLTRIKNRYEHADSKKQKLINWLKFIDTESREERAMLAQTSPLIQIANETVDMMSLSPVERKLYASRMKLKSDIATLSESSFKDGIQQGIQQGAYQKALETAKILKQLHCELSMIIQSTGLSQEEIEKL